MAITIARAPTGSEPRLAGSLIGLWMNFPRTQQPYSPVSAKLGACGTRGRQALLAFVARGADI